MKHIKKEQKIIGKDRNGIRTDYQCHLLNVKHISLKAN